MVASTPHQANTACTSASSPGDTSAGPDPTITARASASARPSARANPPAAMPTDRLMPQPQQISVGTPARTRAATDSTASRTSQGGLPPPSASGYRQRTSSRGKAASGSLSANSTTAAMPASSNRRGWRVSPTCPTHSARPATCRIGSPQRPDDATRPGQKWQHPRPIAPLSPSQNPRPILPDLAGQEAGVSRGEPQRAVAGQDAHPEADAA